MELLVSEKIKHKAPEFEVRGSRKNDCGKFAVRDGYLNLKC